MAPVRKPFPTSPEPSGPSRSPEAGGEGAACVAVQEVDGEALEGVSVGHRPPHRVLELLVAAGDAGAAFRLVGGQRRGQQVGEVVVPHRGHLQVLGGSGDTPQRQITHGLNQSGAAKWD